VTNLIKVKPQTEPAAGAAATEQPARSLGDTLAVALGGAPDGQSAAVSAGSGIAPVANSSADTDSALRELVPRLADVAERIRGRLELGSSIWPPRTF
jgi:hypothetical protein